MFVPTTTAPQENTMTTTAEAVSYEPEALEATWAEIHAKIADGAISNEYNGKTAVQWLDTMKSRYKESADSFERCDTDGFMTQWASNITGDEARLKAELAENGSYHEFFALFDLEGNYVNAHMVDTQYGTAWRIFDNTKQGYPTIGWFRESRAQKAETAAKNNAKKGYVLGKVLAKAYVTTSGANICSVRAVVRPCDPYMVDDTIPVGPFREGISFWG